MTDARNNRMLRLRGGEVSSDNLLDQAGARFPFSADRYVASGLQVDA
jgi:hypothetical protein